MLPPITKPTAARNRLTPRSFSKVPETASLNAVRSTLLGAGNTWGDTQPNWENPSQTTIRTIGAIQEIRSRLRGLKLEPCADRAGERAVSLPRLGALADEREICSIALMIVPNVGVALCSLDFGISR